MTLTPEQSEYVIRKLNEKTRTPDCALCGKNTWTVFPELAELRTYAKGALIAGGAIYPTVVVSCKNCGNMHLLNALLLGIMDDKGEIKNG